MQFRLRLEIIVYNFASLVNSCFAHILWQKFMQTPQIFVSIREKYRNTYFLQINYLHLAANFADTFIPIFSICMQYQKSLPF